MQDLCDFFTFASNYFSNDYEFEELFKGSWGIFMNLEKKSPTKNQIW